MAISLPFLKKKVEKEKSVGELSTEIHQLEHELDQKLGKKHKDPIEARLVKYGFNDQESFEKFQHRIVPTEFPKPARRFRLVLEYPNFNIEQTYYWFLRYFNETWGFEKVEKVLDTMSPSVSSSIFGNLQTRLGAQQGQASQYLKGISEMIKGLFQIVRELRIIDERLQYYYDSDGDKQGKKENSLSSEIVLKGLWIDQVEGGTKNPGSVYGLANTMGFSILPDLFFRIKTTKNNIETTVDKLKFNAKVREVLKRKLRLYYEWKQRTKGELLTRRRFEINYLRQHYDVIRLYISWVKPYLRNVRRLQLYEKNMDNPNIIKAFETQIIELETLFIRDDFGKGGKSGSSTAVISLHIFFRVKPELAFHSYEYQHKGPIYTGMADITLRAYAWEKDKIDNYKKYRQDDELELMGSIDKSIEDAMHALGDDLKRYLKEADPTMMFPGDEVRQSDEEQQPSYPSILEPFMEVFKGFGEIGKAFSGGPKPAGKAKQEKPKKKKAGDIFDEKKVEISAHHFAEHACYEGWIRYKMGPGGNLYWLD
ncbi:hypothetical protein JXC34_05525 [Candidatus Woesearchaeota archaeon]|nr:hypothetical protein [Candidatus Woesearchaeota archaeon]